MDLLKFQTQKNENEYITKAKINSSNLINGGPLIRSGGPGKKSKNYQAGGPVY